MLGCKALMQNHAYLIQKTYQRSHGIYLILVPHQVCQVGADQLKAGLLEQRPNCLQHLKNDVHSHLNFSKHIPYHKYRQEHDLECNLVLISRSKFSLACKANVICSLWKIDRWLVHQSAREINLLLVTNEHEKTSQKVKTDEILKL